MTENIFDAITMNLFAPKHFLKTNITLLPPKTLVVTLCVKLSVCLSMGQIYKSIESKKAFSSFQFKRVHAPMLIEKKTKN